MEARSFTELFLSRSAFSMLALLNAAQSCGVTELKQKNVSDIIRSFLLKVLLDVAR